MTAKLRHVGILVKDMFESMIFYRELGFGITSTLRDWSNEYTEKGKIYTAKLNNQIELIGGPWMPHFAITVESLNRFKLPPKPIFSKETDRVKVCYIQDPDGNVIELVEEK